jgi:hypothetical protein
MLIGKSPLGIDVSHNLKSLWILSFRSSTILSNSGNQLTQRWQFYNNTHPPLAYYSLIIFSAFGPYPYPRLQTDVDFCYSSANFKKSVTGSLPDERMISNGVIWLESLKHFASSNDGASIYY